MGCAKDIVEQAGVPRLYFSNFPLGHSAGKPFDQRSQDATLHGALTLLTEADAPRSTIISEQLWQEDDTWEQDYWDISRLDPSAIEKLKQEHERVRATSATIKKST
jgi:hypothetical protein